MLLFGFRGFPGGNCVLSQNHSAKLTRKARVANYFSPSAGQKLLTSLPLITFHTILTLISVHLLLIEYQ